ncbi:Putative regulatory proteins IclR family [Herminiimonas arsenicoxydans]|uniref:Regulatory proteins IclR family n=1 Tax=Herminiimonas arsenicoxydans TaxID=204773 RepID=A4G8G8_HERAR|nr:Putative regulatory proteins IclR family [Herminiimonas arsenicoxydans]
MKKAENSQKESESISGTQSIERAARILREIASYSAHGLRLVDLARQLNLKRTTIHRILMCLIREGLVMQHPTTLRYMLGYSLFELGLTAASQFKLREICEPCLERIAKKTGHTAFMTIRSELDAISIARADPDPTKPMDEPAIELGVHRPLGVGAGSLAILISLPDDEIERIVSANARRLGPYGKLTVPLLLQLAREAQETGYSSHDSRMLDGLSGVGILVRNSEGAPLGAISITAKGKILSPEEKREIMTVLNRESRILQNQIHKANIDLEEYSKRFGSHHLIN